MYINIYNYKMTSKVKSNILYIASDSSSEE